MLTCRDNIDKTKSPIKIGKKTLVLELNPDGSFNGNCSIEVLHNFTTSVTIRKATLNDFLSFGVIGKDQLEGIKDVLHQIDTFAYSKLIKGE